MSPYQVEKSCPIRSASRGELTGYELERVVAEDLTILVRRSGQRARDSNGAQHRIVKAGIVGSVQHPHVADLAAVSDTKAYPDREVRVCTDPRPVLLDDRFDL